MRRDFLLIINYVLTFSRNRLMTDASICRVHDVTHRFGTRDVGPSPVDAQVPAMTASERAVPRRSPTVWSSRVKAGAVPHPASSLRPLDTIVNV